MAVVGGDTLDGKLVDKLLVLRCLRLDLLRLAAVRTVGTSCLLEPLSAPPEAPIVEHILGGRVQGPVVALSWLAGFTCYLKEEKVSNYSRNGFQMVILGKSSNQVLDQHQIWTKTVGQKMDKVYYLDKTVVEGEIVTNTVLPALFVVPVVGKLVHDEVVDLC